MEQKIFVLTNKRTYRRAVRIFVRGLDGKITDRLCMFTTEHLVNDQERNTNARIIAAQYSTNNEMLYHALLSDSGYGKDFVLKDDPEGKLKEASLKLTPEDVKRATLASLFASQGLKFDGNKPTAILELEYATHIQSLTGVKTQISAPAPIPNQIVDVAKEMEGKKIAARRKYEEDYGEPVPPVVYNDLAFLDGMSNPEFDAKKYIQSKLAEPPKVENNKPAEDGKPEDIHALYFEKFQKNVPNMKKNDTAWIKAKLNE
jgi:hypothetical protein